MSDWRRWGKNYMNIADYGIPKECPFCKSENTDHCFVFISPVKDGVVRNGFTEVWCNSCGKFDSTCCRNVKVGTVKTYTREEYSAHRLKWKNGVYLPNIAVGELAVQTV